MSLEYPASGERQIRPDPVLGKGSGHVDDDRQISELDVLCEMVTSKKCWVGIEKKIPEISR